ncbi:hypothetical protein MRX96_013223 [Rhipicephalus microplus]
MESSSQADNSECVEAVEEVDNNEMVQGEINALYQTPSMSAENYDPESEGPATPTFIPPSDCALAGERHADNDDPEEEADDYRGDASLDMVIERLDIAAHRTVVEVGDNLRKILQKSEKCLHNLLELRDAVMLHEQEQLQKIERAKAIMLSVFENYTQE